MTSVLLMASLIVFLEAAFPSYTVCKNTDSIEPLCYGVSKKRVEALMDESGMVDLESLANE